MLLAALLGVWAWRAEFGQPAPVMAATATVKDGDTLVLGGKTWRLYGIDAPEYRQTCKDAAARDWPCGKAARAQLESFVLSGNLVCHPQAEDKYGREIARCASATTPDLAEAMVTAGLAISPAERGRATYEEAESSARNAKRGIWQGTFETPADWRKSHPREDIK
jgi:endonuclease YncB( thermonuclease family)